MAGGPPSVPTAGNPAGYVERLVDILQSGSEIVIDWFENNKMIVNPDKFQAILLDKRKSHHTN